MNEHLATYPHRNGVSALWLTALPSPADEAAHEHVGADLPRQRRLEMSFRRTAIGLCFDPLFVTVVGERYFEFGDSSESVYVVLAEALDTDLPTETFSQVVELKDRYLVDRIFAPNEPSGSVESLRRIEGLSHYPDPKVEAMASIRWPGFVSFDQTASIVTYDTPEPSVVSYELNDLISQYAIDPKTGGRMIGGDASPIPRVVFLDDFPVYRTVQSVRTNQPGGTTALWAATRGLERTVGTRLSERVNRIEEEAIGDYSTTVSRNPTGY